VLPFITLAFRHSDRDHSTCGDRWPSACSNRPAAIRQILCVFSQTSVLNGLRASRSRKEAQHEGRNVGRHAGIHSVLDTIGTRCWALMQSSSVRPSIR
jgi:hypothetical protein